MNRVFSLMLFALAFSIGALANSVDFTNDQGILSGGNSGLSLTGSTLIAVHGPSGMVTGDLGTLSFSTGALTSGSLQTGGTFASAARWKQPRHRRDSSPDG